jgi:hypothetical protein
VLTHASRHRRAWLIFDVGQNAVSQRLITIGCAGALLAYIIVVFPRWYASRDEWGEQRAASAKRESMDAAVWSAYQAAPWRKLDDMDDPFRFAGLAIIAAMNAEKLDPESYRAKVLQLPGQQDCEITLRHINEFALDRSRKAGDYLGDPCGECRRVLLDLRTKSLSPLLGVQ